MSRVVGFLVEGAAIGRKYSFHIVVPAGMGETVREDLRQLDAVEGIDWEVWEPHLVDAAGARNGSNPGGSSLEDLADFANRNVPVDAWVVTFPHFAGSLRLTKPKATLYPDALPYDFPLGWLDDGSWDQEGSWPKWRAAATKVMADSDAVITFSRHVAARHAGPLCNVPNDKIRVVPLAPPDLKPFLPFLHGRRRTNESRTSAAGLLRRYVDEQGLAYLREFPFEEIDFAAAATQDRPTKNLGFTAEAMRVLIREERRSMKLLLTAPLHFGATWTRLPSLVAGEQIQRDVVSVPDLPRSIHAALFHCASLVVHSSFFEGIIGALPFYEALSVGTPCIMARGPHTDELMEEEPSIEPFLFDPYDSAFLAALISHVATNRESVVEAQAQIYERLSRRSWASVAAEYAEAALTRVRQSSSVQSVIHA